jgi:hypothetical protein
MSGIVAIAATGRERGEECRGNVNCHQHQPLLQEVASEDSDEEFNHMKRQVKWLYIWFYVYLGTLNPFMPSYFFESLKLSTDAVGLLNGLSPMMNLVAAPLWGLLADRLSSSNNPQARKYVLFVVLFMTTVADLSLLLYSNSNAEEGISMGSLLKLRLLSAIFYSSVKGLMDSYTIGCLSDYTANASQQHGKLARTWGEVATGLTSATVGQLVYSHSSSSAFTSASPRFDIAFALRALSFLPLMVCLLSIKQKQPQKKNQASMYIAADTDIVPMDTDIVSCKETEKVLHCNTPDLMQDDCHCHSPRSASPFCCGEGEGQGKCEWQLPLVAPFSPSRQDVGMAFSNAQPQPVPLTSRQDSSNRESSESSHAGTASDSPCTQGDSYPIHLPQQQPSCAPPMTMRPIMEELQGDTSTSNHHNHNQDSLWNIAGFFVVVFCNGLVCRYIETFASICVRVTATKSHEQALAFAASARVLLLLGELGEPMTMTFYQSFQTQLDAGRVMSCCRICLSLGGTFAYYYLSPWLLKGSSKRSSNNTSCNSSNPPLSKDPAAGGGDSSCSNYLNVYRLNGLAVIFYGLCSALYGTETILGCMAAETLRGMIYAIHWTACTHHVQTLSIRGAGRSTLVRTTSMRRGVLCMIAHNLEYIAFYCKACCSYRHATFFDSLFVQQTMLEAVYKGLGASLGSMLGGTLLAQYSSLPVAFSEVGKAVMIVGCLVGALAELVSYFAIPIVSRSRAVMIQKQQYKGGKKQKLK